LAVDSEHGIASLLGVVGLLGGVAVARESLSLLDLLSLPLLLLEILFLVAPEVAVLLNLCLLGFKLSLG
jgi:hypothetical protein